MAKGDWSPSVWETMRRLVAEGEIPTPELLRQELPDTPPKVIAKQLLWFRMKNQWSGLGM